MACKKFLAPPLDFLIEKKIKTLRLYVLVNHLLKDYCFPSYPLSFEQYRFSDGKLDLPLLESLDTLSLLVALQGCLPDWTLRV